MIEGFHVMRLEIEIPSISIIDDIVRDLLNKSITNNT